MSESSANKYDAVLLVSFGGPEGPDDVLPFLENVLRGRNVPRERMLEVSEHYQHFGGISPINGQNRELIAALQAALNECGPKLPIYFGNRNWHPMMADTMQKMVDDGVTSALAVVTSAFSCYSGCRQYREDIAKAQEAVGDAAPAIDKMRVYFNHPGFVEAMVDRVTDALNKLPEDRRDAAQLVFTAHSIPNGMAEGAKYEVQLKESSRLVTEGLGRSAQSNWRLVFQSRSGPPSQPWLEPDICDYIEEIHAQGDVKDIVIVPIGFISDHMEVLFDLDTEAKELCEKIGMGMQRAGTVGTHPAFVECLRAMIEERLTESELRPALGELGPSHDVCPLDCCPSGRPQRPAAARG